VTRDGYTRSKCVRSNGTPPETGHWHWRKSAATVAVKAVKTGAVIEHKAAQEVAELFDEDGEE
jgi:hypothetical protein